MLTYKPTDEEITNLSKGLIGPPELLELFTENNCRKALQEAKGDKHKAVQMILNIKKSK